MVKMPHPNQAFTIGFGSSRLVDNALFTVFSSGKPPEI